jgi:hypothetical protein
MILISSTKGYRATLACFSLEFPAPRPNLLCSVRVYELIAILYRYLCKNQNFKSSKEVQASSLLVGNWGPDAILNRTVHELVLPLKKGESYARNVLVCWSRYRLLSSFSSRGSVVMLNRKMLCCSSLLCYVRYA